MPEQVSPETTNTTGTMLGKFTSPMNVSSGDNTIAMLNGILGLVMLNDVDKKLRDEEAKNHQNEQKMEDERRHNEIVKALSLKRKPKKATKHVEKEEQTAKKATKEAKKEEKVSEVPAGKSSTPTASKVENLPRSVPKAVREVPEVPKMPLPKATPVAPSSLSKAAIVAIAGISIAGETSARTKKATLEKGSQIVPNDPEPGYYSYGIFGMNSKAKTADKFVQQYPELGIKGKSGTKEFNDSWSKVAKERPQDLYDAQIDWYDKNVVKPLRSDLNKSLPGNIASDTRVIAFMSDRRIQYGKVLENEAFASASNEKTPEGFIVAMTDYDMKHLDKAFPTYLKHHPDAVKGLQKRLQLRKSKAMEIDSNLTIGDRMYGESNENQALRESLEKTPQQKITNNVISSNTQKSQKQTRKEYDDMPVLLKKNK